jgi:hypothetical protein
MACRIYADLAPPTAPAKQDVMRVLVGTRKGSFFVEKSGGSWKARLAGHPGVGVNFVTRDPHTGTLWAALGHGHWGAKLSRSSDDGASWADAAPIKYPPGARYLSPPDPDPNASEADMKKGPTLRDATLLKLWIIAFGAPGQVHVGTIPGGLFTSTDGGQSFELNRALWNHESRGGDLFSGPGTGHTHWFGTPASDGEFAAGIHSIAVHPRDPNRILVAVSTAGVIETPDGGTNLARPQPRHAQRLPAQPRGGVGPRPALRHPVRRTAGARLATKPLRRLLQLR